MHETILEYAKSMGAVGEDQEALLEALCATAEAELGGKLREGVAPQDCNGAFPLAAAWLARAGLCGAESAEGAPTSWSAGAVRVTASAPAGERADGLRAQAYQLMAPYLKNERFFFQGVRG